MKAPLWTPEKLRDLDVRKLEALRSNAARLGDASLVASCDVELASRRPAPRSRIIKQGAESAVVGFHFVCERDRGVTVEANGEFWSGSWVVAEKVVQDSLKTGAYLALHLSKAQKSYRQGQIIAFRIAERTMIKKRNLGIEFRAVATDTPYDWVGDGAGEKGYNYG